MTEFERNEESEGQKVIEELQRWFKQKPLNCCLQKQYLNVDEIHAY